MPVAELCGGDVVTEKQALELVPELAALRNHQRRHLQLCRQHRGVHLLFQFHDHAERCLNLRHGVELRGGEGLRLQGRDRLQGVTMEWLLLGFGRLHGVRLFENPGNCCHRFEMTFAYFLIFHADHAEFHRNGNGL